MHIATWFFSKKLGIFLDRLIPILGLRHYWYRIESQGRGSDHTHGALWYEDAPDLCALSNEIKLGFISSKKLDTFYGEDKEALSNSKSKSWFEDKTPIISKLFTPIQIDDTYSLMNKKKIPFMEALKRDLQQQQNSNYKKDLRLSIFFPSFFTLL